VVPPVDALDASGSAPAGMRAAMDAQPGYDAKRAAGEVRERS
jgi:hypothetical protein